MAIHQACCGTEDISVARSRRSETGWVEICVVRSSLDDLEIAYRQITGAWRNIASPSETGPTCPKADLKHLVDC